MGVEKFCCSPVARILIRTNCQGRRLLELRAALDVWIAAHRGLGIPIAELAHFEGLLAERRSALEELLSIDDELLDTVLTLQNSLARTSRDQASEA